MSITCAQYDNDEKLAMARAAAAWVARLAYLPAEPRMPEPAPEGQTVFGHISKRVSPSDTLPALPVEGKG